MYITDLRFGRKEVLTIDHEGKQLTIELQRVRYGAVRIAIQADETFVIKPQEVEDPSPS